MKKKKMAFFHFSEKKVICFTLFTFSGNFQKKSCNKIFFSKKVVNFPKTEKKKLFFRKMEKVKKIHSKNQLPVNFSQKTSDFFLKTFLENFTQKK